METTVTIIGAGYVGVTTAAIFANAGYTVFVIEINPDRLASLEKGISFFHEQYLNKLLANAIDRQTLTVTSSYKEAVSKSDIILSCVGTPDNSDGSSNLQYIFSAATETAKYAKSGAIYVQKSTVPIGTGEQIETLFTKHSATIKYVSSPEFLREGTALVDSLWPDRIIVGGDDIQATATINRIYKHVLQSRKYIQTVAFINKAEIAKLRTIPEYITTSRNSSELIKVSANAFLALKISFANSIAKLADAADADITEVMNGIGSDNRIGKSFLSAGRGYGGGCFPKDVRGLISSGLQHGVDIRIMQSASIENDSMPGYILEKVNSLIGNSFQNKKIAVLGASFKAGTSDIRKSPAIAMATILSEKMDANVHIYDPVAFSDPLYKSHFSNGIVIEKTMALTLKQADIVIIATDWPEFIEAEPEYYKSQLKGNVVVDAMNCLDKDKFESAGMHYIGVGK